MATIALQDLLNKYKNGEIDKEEYDRQKKIIVLNLTSGQNNQQRSTTSSRNPSRRLPNQNPSRTITEQPQQIEQFEEPQEEFVEEEQYDEDPNKPRVKLYGQINKVTKNSINLNKYEKRDMEKNPITSRTSFDPTYGFGKDKTGVADVDEMLDYLEKLDLLLQDVETSQERYKRLQNELPSGVFVSKDPKNLKNEDSVPKKLRAGKILNYCEKNRVKKVEQYLDMGVSVNYQDHDTGNTPLIVSAVYGQREVMQFLVERGASVNLQNNYGDSALHELIKNRRENLAIWLIKHGADIFIENHRTFTPYDLALPYFQKDMKKLTAGVDISQHYAVKENFQTSYTLQSNDSNNESKNLKETSKPIKVYLKNLSYKSLFITSVETTAMVLAMMGEKMGLSKEQSRDLMLVENQRGKERKMLEGEKILEVKRGWPLIIDQTAKVDPVHFRVEPKSTAKQDVKDAYTKFINT